MKTPTLSDIVRVLDGLTTETLETVRQELNATCYTTAKPLSARARLEAVILIDNYLRKSRYIKYTIRNARVFRRKPSYDE